MIETTTPKVPIAIRANLNVDDVSVLIRSTETVSDTANGMNQRIGLQVVDLAAQAADIDINDIGRRVEVEIPDMLQHHGPRYDPTLVAHEIFQQLEFLGQEFDVRAAP